MISLFCLKMIQSNRKPLSTMVCTYFRPLTSLVSVKVAYLHHRVAEVVWGLRGPPPKSLDSDENFKREHMLFGRGLRFVAIYALFGDLWAKKVLFWVKNSVSWARSALFRGIYCIFY